jgi:hypothetical protein
VNNYGGGYNTSQYPGMETFPNMVYDPTNGTVSWGDVIRVGHRIATTSRGYAPIETLPQ